MDEMKRWLKKQIDEKLRFGLRRKLTALAPTHACRKDTIKPRFDGKAELVRYADDLCLFFRSPTDVDTMRILLQARLAQFGLTLAEEKTHKTNLGMDNKPAQLLGWKSISGEDVEFFKCPECGILTDFHFGNECFKCSMTIPDGGWLDAKEKAHVAVCASCDQRVDLTSRNRSMFSRWGIVQRASHCPPCASQKGRYSRQSLKRNRLYYAVRLKWQQNPNRLQLSTGDRSTGHSLSI